MSAPTRLRARDITPRMRPHWEGRDHLVTATAIKGARCYLRLQDGTEINAPADSELVVLRRAA